MKVLFLLGFLVFSTGILGQQSVLRLDSVGKEVQVNISSGVLYGSLLLPEDTPHPLPVVLIIAGSGPTDRNGNSILSKNESLRKLAEGLAARGIASLRFDKRGVGKSRAAMTREQDLRFEDYVADAKAWLEYLKKDPRFSTVSVIGHSEGSLIGLLIAKEADHFISIAGIGRSADKVLTDQLSAQSPQLGAAALPVLDSLKAGFLVKSPPPSLLMLFRPSVQPYMISWFRYEPAREIRNLTIPVLILQGTNDIQVGVSEAKWLQQGNTRSRLVLVDSMNHLLKIVGPTREENQRSYQQPELPVSGKLLDAVADFLRKDR